MSWNYRLMAFEAHEIQKQNGNDTPWMEIRDVYYDEAGKPNGYGDRGERIGGENIEEIRIVLQLMKDALSKPVLWGGDKWGQIYEAPETIEK